MLEKSWKERRHCFHFWAKTQIPELYSGGGATCTFNLGIVPSSDEVPTLLLIRSLALVFLQRARREYKLNKNKEQNRKEKQSKAKLVFVASTCVCVRR